jgi:hypothetical protein
MSFNQIPSRKDFQTQGDYEAARNRYLESVAKAREERKATPQRRLQKELLNIMALSKASELQFSPHPHTGKVLVEVNVTGQGDPYKSHRWMNPTEIPEGGKVIGYPKNPKFERRHYADIAGMLHKHQAPPKHVEEWVSRFTRDNPLFDEGKFRQVVAGGAKDGGRQAAGPKYSKQIYEEIANMLAARNADQKEVDDWVELFVADNPRFDRDRFNKFIRSNIKDEDLFGTVEPEMSKAFSDEWEVIHTKPVRDYELKRGVKPVIQMRHRGSGQAYGVSADNPVDAADKIKRLYPEHFNKSSGNKLEKAVADTIKRLYPEHFNDIAKAKLPDWMKDVVAQRRVQRIIDKKYPQYKSSGKKLEKAVVLHELEKAQVSGIKDSDFHESTIPEPPRGRPTVSRPIVGIDCDTPEQAEKLYQARLKKEEVLGELEKQEQAKVIGPYDKCQCQNKACAHGNEKSCGKPASGNVGPWGMCADCLNKWHEIHKAADADLSCPECKHKLLVSHEWCPGCGAKVTDQSKSEKNKKKGEVVDWASLAWRWR